MSTDRILIGIAGGTGSGKTTVVRALRERFGEGEVTVLEQDHYYRPLPELSLEERARINYDHPDAFDSELFLEHVRALRTGLPIDRPIYDFVTHSRRTDAVFVEPSHVIILEGILVLWSEKLRAQMDIKLFVDTDADVRLLRRLKRDIEDRGRTLDSVIEQYLETVRPMHLQFVEPSKRHADVIIPEGGRNRVALDVLGAKIGDLLRRRKASELAL
jgi:uridine kinase